MAGKDIVEGWLAVNHEMTIELRPFTRAEYHAFYADYVADPIMDPNFYHYHREHVDRCFDFEQTRQAWYPVFGIFLRNGECVGTLALKRIDQVEHRCEIGIMMRDDHCKNHGYGTQAMQAAIRMAEKEYGVERIYADTMGSNARMQHILDKLGFQLLERIPHAYDMRDRWEDKLNYVLEVHQCEKS